MKKILLGDSVSPIEEYNVNSFDEFKKIILDELKDCFTEEELLRVWNTDEIVFSQNSDFILTTEE
jgi:hypothetical protein